MSTTKALAPSLRPSAASVAVTTPALIVLGRDEGGKAHASWFDESEAKLASKAAALMGMRALTITTDELRTVAGRLPHGRVFASGRAFVHFVKASVFDQLATHLPEGIDASPKSDAGGDEIETSEGSGSSDEDAAPPAWTEVPSDWSKIGVGSPVLAPEADEGDGWFESIVVEVRGDDLFIPKWRDWPDEPTVVRRRCSTRPAGASGRSSGARPSAN